MGHGSTENPDSSTLYFDHAAEIRKRGRSAEVHCCFWRKGPSMRAALDMIGVEEVAPGAPPEACTLFIVVPFFIADGLHSYQDIPVMLGFEKEQRHFARLPRGLQPLRCPSPEKIERGI